MTQLELFETPEETLEKRETEYGKFEDNAKIAQQLSGVIEGYMYSRGKELSTVHHQCFHMIFTKIARMVTGDPMHADSAHDIAGYGLLLEKYIKDHAGK